ncbi:lysosome-associated membrane glycoprotein 1 isoform X2 [Solenopsis invicta]|uniref:lysosome-associated membrane glycoprotein 1 isoform X2 n=1 Tax=Solenopsis invicta TaxID=13686 RepID=UPI000595FAEA|nr:lysosome-associated membrane glycoprotein 1 isoform X2 [Solenopsis invicta]
MAAVHPAFLEPPSFPHFPGPLRPARANVFVVSRYDFLELPRTFDAMLRPLLLLCWVATIMSADLGTATNSNPTGLNEHMKSTVEIKDPNLSISSSTNVGSKPDDKSTSTLTLNAASTPEPTPIETTPPPKKPSTKPPPPPPITSTTAPNTSTAAPTTPAPTTPAPTTPLPPPSSGRWSFAENNTLCIIVQMAVQFNFSFTNVDNVTIHKAMDIPLSSNVTTGKCGKTEQNLTLSWKLQNNTAMNNFTIHFVKNETEKYYSLHHFEISLAATEFPNVKSNKTVTLVHVAPSFKTGLSNSYRCIKEQQLNLTLEGKNVTVGLLKVTNLQFQAFRGDNSTTFGLAKDCSFDTPDIVPITVGCALAGLVVIVLIAYLVGRRRSQARGYLSM